MLDVYQSDEDRRSEFNLHFPNRSPVITISFCLEVLRYLILIETVFFYCSIMHRAFLYADFNEVAVDQWEISDGTNDTPGCTDSATSRHRDDLSVGRSLVRRVYIIPNRHAPFWIVIINR